MNLVDLFKKPYQHETKQSRLPLINLFHLRHLLFDYSLLSSQSVLSELERIGGALYLKLKKLIVQPNLSMQLKDKANLHFITNYL